MTSNLSDLINKMNNIPDAGYLLIYTRQKVFFRRYSGGLDGIAESIKNEITSSILECHFFDDNVESRAIYSEVYNGGDYICSMISDDKYLEQLKSNYNDLEHVMELPVEYKYEENMHLTDKAIGDIGEDSNNANWKIKVITYLVYDENDMIQVKNYRYGKVAKEEK